MNLDEHIDPLDRLRAKLTGETIAVAIFKRIDGRVFSVSHVRVDSIGPSAEAPGVVGVEFENDSMRVLHLPFIESWEIEYL